MVKKTTDNNVTQKDATGNVADKIALQTAVHEAFGRVAGTMMNTQRYRDQSIGDLNNLLLQPLLRNRVAIASSKQTVDGKEVEISGSAIWASVSEEVDAKIKTQIHEGVFPIRLKADEWNSGDINWLLDVFAPGKEMTAGVIASLSKVIGTKRVNLHPIIGRLVDQELLRALGAKSTEG